MVSVLLVFPDHQKGLAPPKEKTNRHTPQVSFFPNHQKDAPAKKKEKIYPPFSFSEPGAVSSVSVSEAPLDRVPAEEVPRPPRGQSPALQVLRFLILFFSFSAGFSFFRVFVWCLFVEKENKIWGSLGHKS